MSRTSVCHFYQAGSCRNGVTCPFGHPTVRCRTFTSTGWCPYGYNCYFWHDCSQARVLTTTFKRKSCIFFANNQCKYGDACAFSHDLESQNHSSAMTLAEYRSSKILSPQTFLQQPNVTKRLQPVHDVACVGEGRSSTTVTPPMKITSLPNTILTPNPNKVATHFRINETNEADICHLQNIEIERMLKSFPADKLCEVQSFGDGRTFCLKFSSTDPDWAYDVREITINVHIRPMYPLEPLRITVLSNEYLPDLLVEYLNKAVESWIASKHKELSQTDRKGLYLRLFFRWLDRNLEDLFTEALRKLRSLLVVAEQDSRENGSFAPTQHQITVGAPVSCSLTHLTDISHSHANVTLDSQGQRSCQRSNLSDAEISAESAIESDQPINSPSNSGASEVEFDGNPAKFQSARKPAPDYPDDKTPEWVDAVHRLELNSEDNEAQVATPSGFSRSGIPFESVPIGKITQTLSMSELRLSGKVGTLVQRRLSAMLHCTRCKLSFMWVFSLHGGQLPTVIDTTLPLVSRLRSLPPHSVNCARCRLSMDLMFQANIAHAFANHVGSFYLNGCVADDVPPKLSELVLLCTECNRSVKLVGLEPGRPSRKRCFNCHSVLGVEFKALKLEAAKESEHSCHSFRLSDVVTASKTNEISRRRDRAIISAQSSLIQDGSPLPSYGACKHYRKSYRWLRFPCCGRLAPCDVCHDEGASEAHAMEIATRMVCGFCSKEQLFSSTKPCMRCGKHLTGSRSAHWEGGKGCRNRLTMSRKDSKKYSEMNKTAPRGKSIS